MLARAVYPLHGPGGLERHVHDLVRWLLRSGVRVTLVTPPPRHPATRPAVEQTLLPDPGSVSGGDVSGDSEGLVPPPLPLADARRLTVTHVSYWTFPFASRRGTTILDRTTAYPLYGLRAGRFVEGLVRRGGIQLVHAHGASGLGYARARLRRRVETVPFVLNPHGLEEFGPGEDLVGRLKRLAYRPLQASVRASARAADCIVATDRSLVDQVVRALDVAPARVRVVPNAVDVERIDRLTDARVAHVRRASVGLEPDGLLLVSAGRLERNKGFEVLVRALANLVRLDADRRGVSRLGGRWRWVIVGDGAERQRLVRAVEASGLAANVVFAGRIGEADLHAWLEAASLFVHPTLYEGSSIVTLEAMAHRRPVVATTAGGLPDKVVPGVNGWLVAPGRSDELATALGEALDARARWREFGEASRAIVERDFNWSRVVRTWLDLYREVLTRRIR